MPHTANPVAQHHRRPPKVDRPKLMDNIGEESWNAFSQDWEMFVRANSIHEDDKVIQLFSCCDAELKAKVTASCNDVFTKSVRELLTLLKDLAVIPVAVSVKRTELLQMHQDAGENIKNFLSRVKGKAINCGFRVECTHAHAAPAGQNVPPEHVFVNYTDEMLRHVILNGLYDDDIRCDVFSTSELDGMDIKWL